MGSTVSERLIFKKFLIEAFRHLPDPELQRRAPEGFQYLSSVFVKVEAVGYGTRTHTIILVDKEWNVEFIESTMQEPIDVQNPKWNTQTIKSRL